MQHWTMSARPLSKADSKGHSRSQSYFWKNIQNKWKICPAQSGKWKQKIGSAQFSDNQWTMRSKHFFFLKAICVISSTVDFRLEREKKFVLIRESLSRFRLATLWLLYLSNHRWVESEIPHRTLYEWKSMKILLDRHDNGKVNPNVVASSINCNLK